MPAAKKQKTANQGVRVVKVTPLRDSKGNPVEAKGGPRTKQAEKAPVEKQTEPAKAPKTGKAVAFAVQPFSGVHLPGRRFFKGDAIVNTGASAPKSGTSEEDPEPKSTPKKRKQSDSEEPQSPPPKGTPGKKAV